MLYWAVVFLIVAIIAGVLGFGGISAGAASIAQILFYIFLVVFLVSLIMHFTHGRHHPPGHEPSGRTGVERGSKTLVSCAYCLTVKLKRGRMQSK